MNARLVKNDRLSKICANCQEIFYIQAFENVKFCYCFVKMSFSNMMFVVRCVQQ